MVDMLLTSAALLRAEAEECRRVMGALEASNLSGVVKAMANAVSVLWDVSRAMGQGTDWVNQHPVMLLYAERAATLTHYATCANDLSLYGSAMMYCTILSQGIRVAAPDTYLSNGSVIKWDTGEPAWGEGLVVHQDVSRGTDVLIERLRVDDAWQVRVLRILPAGWSGLPARGNGVEATP